MTRTFELTPKQKEVRATFASAAKYFLIYGGSRSGKTFLTIYTIITRMVKAPGSRHVVFRNDGIDAKQSIGNETVPAVLALAYPGLVLKWHDQDGYYQAPNGAQLWLAGLKDKARLDKVLGKEFATIYLNEASQITLEAFSVVQTRLAQSVVQTNGKRLPLRLYVDLNPTVAAHWTYQIWVNGIHPDGGKAIADYAEKYRHMTINPADNAENLPPDYLQALANLPERMKRRFYDGEYTADDDNALWRRAWIKQDTLAQYGRIVVAIDPATTNTIGSDETGIIVAGLGGDQRGYVLADESGKFRPEEWARRAISLYDTFSADCIVAEVNQGGDMVEAMIKAESRGRTIPVKKVTATRAKHIRAEPVAALYEQGKVRHAQEFATLEDQLCAFTIDFDRAKKGYSPDRCLVAGTMVATSEGQARIEDIRAGDMVWTRNGLRSVIAAQMTSPSADIVAVSVGGRVAMAGTGNHPIWSKGRGFVPMDTLVWSDKLLHISENTEWKRKSSRSTGLIMSGILAAQANQRRGISTSAQAKGRNLPPFIGIFGRFITARFLTASTCITSMGIAQTMIQPTWLPSALPIIQPSMRHCIQMSSSAHGRNVWNMQEALPAHGMGRMPGLRSMWNLGSAVGKIADQLPAFVRSAALNMKRSLCGLMGAAAGNASTVEVSATGSRAPVFNLRVDGDNEYYANGYLVHNCDALVWAFTELFPSMTERAKPVYIAPPPRVAVGAGRRF